MAHIDRVVQAVRNVIGNRHWAAEILKEIADTISTGHNWDVITPEELGAIIATEVLMRTQKGPFGTNVLRFLNGFLQQALSHDWEFHWREHPKAPIELHRIYNVLRDISH